MGIFDGIDFGADQNRLGMALLAAAGPSREPQSFGQRLFAGMSAHDKYLSDKEEREQIRKQREAQAQFQQMQMMQMIQAQAERKAQQEKAAAIEGAYRGAIRSPDQQAMGQFGGPTVAAAQAAPGMTPQIDQRALIESLAKVDPMTAFQMMQPKPRKLMNVAPGASVIDEASPDKPVFTAPDRSKDQPTSVQEFLYAQQNPEFSQWDMARKRAGATNIGLPRIDIKTGEGIAGQVGPMLKGSQEQALAGVKLVDSAQRILSATQGGNVIVGPMADLRLKTAQFADLLGVGGKNNEEKIQNTRSVVRGMAEQAVAARSQLGGQAQISNSEQELLNKATSGAIGELTAGEVVQIAKLNDRLGRMMYGKHQNMLKAMESVPDTQNLRPFFQVPELPTAAPMKPSGPSLDDLLKKYGG